MNRKQLINDYLEWQSHSALRKLGEPEGRAARYMWHLYDRGLVDTFQSLYWLPVLVAEIKALDAVQ